MPFRGSPYEGDQKKGYNSYLLGVPMREKDRYDYVTPCRFGFPIVGKDLNGYITLAFSVLGVPMVGIDQYGCFTPVFSGIPNRGTKSEVAAQILPSWGPRKMPKKT